MTSSIALTSSWRGAESDSSAVSNASPSRTLITAMPWSPIVPLSTTASPGSARRGRTSTPSGTAPTPLVLT